MDMKGSNQDTWKSISLVKQETCTPGRETKCQTGAMRGTVSPPYSIFSVWFSKPLCLYCAPVLGHTYQQISINFTCIVNYAFFVIVITIFVLWGKM